MAQIDAVKEEISLAKFWLGVFTAVDISLIGWFLSNVRNETFPKLIGCFILVIGVFVGAILMHREVKADIKRLKET